MLVASVKLPTPDELKAVGRQLGMTLSDADVDFFLQTMAGSVAAYHAVEAMADPMPRVKYPRTPGYRPMGAENKYNAWYYKSEVAGALSGKLKGKRVALKDNVCLAGVPLMNGASTLEGRSSARCTANTSASRAAATRAPRAPSTTRERWATRRAGPRQGARRSLPPARSRWPSEVIRAG